MSCWKIILMFNRINRWTTLIFDDNVQDIVLEKNCLRYRKTNDRTFYCGTDCQIIEGDTKLTLPVTSTPQEYLSTNETFLMVVPEWAKNFSSSCEYIISSWTSVDKFFLQIFDGDLYFRSCSFCSTINKGELVMTDVVSIFTS